MKIDKKYHVKLQGIHNLGVYDCPYCDNRMITRLLKHALGFAEWNGDIVVVIQCDKCFEKFYFHVNKDFYGDFVAEILLGNNVYYK
jgi:hypothetical protein